MTPFQQRILCLEIKTILPVILDYEIVGMDKTYCRILVYSDIVDNDCYLTVHEFGDAAGFLETEFFICFPDRVRICLNFTQLDELQNKLRCSVHNEIYKITGVLLDFLT